MGPETGLLGIGIGALVGDRRENRQHGRQKELMGIQYGNQHKLNAQGQALNMKTWNETNYGAQMEHMRKAGLNPGLMYGMSGGGGATTGNQGGGSAAGGSAGGGMALELQGAMMESQIELAKSQANKNNVEAQKIGTVDTEQVDAQTLMNKEQTKKIWNEINLMGYERARREMENEEKGYETEAIRNNEQEWLKSKIAGWQTVGIKKQAEEMGIELTEERVQQIKHKIWQDWVNAGSGVLASASFVKNAIKGLKKK